VPGLDFRRFDLPSDWLESISGKPWDFTTSSLGFDSTVPVSGPKISKNRVPCTSGTYPPFHQKCQKTPPLAANLQDSSQPWAILSYPLGFPPGIGRWGSLDGELSSIPRLLAALKKGAFLGALISGEKEGPRARSEKSDPDNRCESQRSQSRKRRGVSPPKQAIVVSRPSENPCLTRDLDSSAIHRNFRKEFPAGAGRGTLHNVPGG